MVGMRDVAKKAGVSLSTVSLVVNDTGYVSAEMRAKVESAMRALNYFPNELARNLYHNRTDVVGVIVPTIRHPFFATLVAELQRVFAEQGRRTLLCSTADADKGEADYVDMLRRRMMDGIVMASHTEHPSDYWTSIGCPVVAFDRVLGEGISSVGSDHEQGGRLIAQELLRTGARHVVTVGGPRRQFEDLNGITFPTVRYHLTVEKVLEAAGVRCDYVEAGEVSALSDHAAAARQVFDRFEDVDAIVGSDIVASYCVQEARKRGLAVPDDVQVIAYDGTYMADAAGVRLSAITQDLPAIAERIGMRMEQAINGDNGLGGPTDLTGMTFGIIPGNVTDVIPVSFVRGDSTR